MRERDADQRSKRCVFLSTALPLIHQLHLFVLRLEPRPTHADSQNFAINLAGAGGFSALLVLDKRGEAARKERRQEIKRRQIEFGDREIYVNQVRCPSGGGQLLRGIRGSIFRTQRGLLLPAKSGLFRVLILTWHSKCAAAGILMRRRRVSG